MVRFWEKPLQPLNPAQKPASQVGKFIIKGWVSRIYDVCKIRTALLDNKCPDILYSTPINKPVIPLWTATEWLPESSERHCRFACANTHNARDKYRVAFVKNARLSIDYTNCQRTTSSSTQENPSCLPIICGDRSIPSKMMYLRPRSNQSSLLAAKVIRQMLHNPT